MGCVGAVVGFVGVAVGFVVGWVTTVGMIVGVDVGLVVGSELGCTEEEGAVSGISVTFWAQAQSSRKMASNKIGK